MRAPGGMVKHAAIKLNVYCLLFTKNAEVTIAFPLISAGVYGYPQRDAIRVAIETMKLHQDDFDEITLVLFGEREFGFAGEMFPEFIL